MSATLPIPGKTAMGPKGSATHDAWGSFAHAFETAQQIVTSRARLGHFWPLFELFGDKSTSHVNVIRQWLDPIVSRVVDERTRARVMGATSPVEERSFLQHLADNTEGKLLT
jgi:hypothetical protein